jgi:hypothetical protein
MKFRITSLCLLLTLACCVSAQDNSQIAVPQLIRFSGQLKGIIGTVGITFTLHKEQRDDAALWIETQNVQLDAAGRYGVLLGATKPEGLPAELFTSGEAQWLGIRVQGRPEEPRVLLVSVPYALRAAEADTLGGHAANEFVTTGTLADAVQQQLQPQATSAHGAAVTRKSADVNASASEGATNFSATNASQVVLVTQGGTGAALAATAGNNYALSGASTSTAIYGSSTGATHSTAAAIEGITSSSSGRGIFGYASAATGFNFGLSGQSNSSSGTGIFAVSTAASGATVGLQAQVASPSGTAAVFQNRGGGKLIAAQSGASNSQVFSVDGSGNVSASGQVSGSSVVLSGAKTTFVGAGNNPAVNAAGNALTVFAGSAALGATDKPGGDLILTAGNGTGLGGSGNIQLMTAPPVSSGHTPDAMVLRRFISGQPISMGGQNGYAQIFQVNVPAGVAAAVTLHFTIRANDGGANFAAETGSCMLIGAVSADSSHSDAQAVFSTDHYSINQVDAMCSYAAGTFGVWSVSVEDGLSFTPTVHDVTFDVENVSGSPVTIFAGSESAPVDPRTQFRVNAQSPAVKMHDKGNAISVER